VREGDLVPTGSAQRPHARRRRRPPRSSLVLRWLGLGVVVLVGFLYYRPLATYLETKEALEERAAEVSALRGEQRRLERQLALSSGTEALVVQARRLGLVREGERLFIVKGIEACKRRQCWRPVPGLRVGPRAARSQLGRGRP
jgi:cell division protein FtsB